MSATPSRNYDTAIRQLPARHRQTIEAVLDDPDDHEALAALDALRAEAKAELLIRDRMVAAIQWEQRTWATRRGRFVRRLQRLVPGRWA